MEEIQARTTQDRFHITVKVQESRFNYREHQSRGKQWNEVANAIILEFDTTTENDLFINAWMPDQLTEEEKAQLHGAKDYAEVVLEAGSPIFGYFRAALCHPNQHSDKPHLFVMTKGAEERLQAAVGKRMVMTSLGEQEEESLYCLKLETRSPYTDIQ